MNFKFHIFTLTEKNKKSIVYNWLALVRIIPKIVLCNIDYSIFQKCFMVLNVKTTLKLTKNLTAVIPKIISPSVQQLYSAFGRETNGFKKLNFSGTESYKYLIGTYII